MTQQFNFFKVNTVYHNLFLRFPRVLLHGKQYKHISSDAKIAYMVLADRLEYSLQNDWVDEDNHVYFIFTNEELMDLLELSNKTVVKVKKELMDKGLLLQRRMGLNQPNRLYLSELEVSATDVYKKPIKHVSTPDKPGSVNFTLPETGSKTLEKTDFVKSENPQKLVSTLGKQGSVNSTLPGDTPQTLGGQGSVNSTLPEKHVSNLDTKGSVNSTHYLDIDKDNTDIKNRYKKSDTRSADISKKITSSQKFEKQKQNKLEQELVSHLPQILMADKNINDCIFDSTGIQMISWGTQTAAEAKEFIRVVLSAKRRAEKDLGNYIINCELDGWNEEMNRALRRYFWMIRTDTEHKIKNPYNYLFMVFKTLFLNYPKFEQQAQKMP